MSMASPLFKTKKKTISQITIFECFLWGVSETKKYHQSQRDWGDNEHHWTNIYNTWPIKGRCSRHPKCNKSGNNTNKASHISYLKVSFSGGSNTKRCTRTREHYITCGIASLSNQISTAVSFNCSYCDRMVSVINHCLFDGALDRHQF